MSQVDERIQGLFRRVEELQKEKLNIKLFWRIVGAMSVIGLFGLGGAFGLNSDRISSLAGDMEEHEEIDKHDGAALTDAVVEGRITRIEEDIEEIEEDVEEIRKDQKQILEGINDLKAAR